MTLQEKDTPEQLVEKISAFIRLSLEHVADGGEANLEGLDAKVKELCDAVLDMPKPKALEYEKKLEDIAADLDILKRGMVMAQEELEQQLAELNLRHKAAKAYKISEGGLPPKPLKGEE